MSNGDIIEYDDLEKLMAQADSVDREMLLVVSQARTIEANTSVASLRAR